jgi:alpha-beta hydrolase superfamily lysophospholipase
MTLNTQKLLQLASQLPKLEFSLVNDGVWQQNEAAQAYLNFYHVNFAQEFSGVSHGFGRIDAAGFQIATHYWLPKSAAGTLVIVHGYYDHVGVFGHVIRFALARNLAVLAFDLPGHGLSSGEPAVIDSFNQYGDVFAEIVELSKAFLPQPLYALGQSTGCAVILNYLWRYAVSKNAVDIFDKIALCSPLVLARGWRGIYMGRFVYTLVRHFVKVLNRGPSRSSHDQEFNKFIMQDDLLQAKYLSLRWVGAMKEWNNMFSRFAPLQKKLLVVQGTGDMTVDWQYNLPLIQRKLPNAKISMIADAGHQLANESEYYRAQLFAALDQYFQTNL